METVINGKQAFDKEKALYTHVVVRQDLSPEQQMVQAIHAAASATAEFGGLTSDTRLVLLSVRNQDELQHLACQLNEKSIPFHMFHEPDYGVGFSALATPPDTMKNRKAFKKLSLWRFNPAEKKMEAVEI